MNERTRETFDERCYRLLRRVPAGKVTTYQELAHAVGTRAYRAVGNAMNRNPHAPIVPCHRVVKCTGDVGGYAGGTAKKIKLLREEGIPIRNGRVEELADYLYRF